MSITPVIGKKNSQNQKARLLEYKDYSDSMIENIYERFNTSVKGLSQEEAEERLDIYGYNEPANEKRKNVALSFLFTFLNPLVIVLLIIATASLFLDNKIGSYLIYLMAFISVTLTFFQEFKANKETLKLIEMVSSTATIYRDNKLTEIKIKEIVPGDIIFLSAGDMIPADLRLITCKDLFINQASLTGESFPVEKYPISDNKNIKSIIDLNNILFMGTSVLTGTALAIVIQTGLKTQFGELAQKIVNIRTQTSFDKGLRKYTWLMIRLMSILVVVIFAINAFTKNNVLEALFFALAVAIGMTPEMLPLLVAINLSKGAISMSRKKVIVKRLNSIQNFGAMNILCTDKTGTLTIDKIVLERHCDIKGKEDEDVLKFTYINSYYQTGLKNLLDRAILEHKGLAEEMLDYKKIDEMPFDFSRKIMSVVVERDNKRLLITKGRPEEIFKRCTKYEYDGDIYNIDEQMWPVLKTQVEKLNFEGFRTVAIAYKDIFAIKDVYSKEDEEGLVLKGYIAFLDPPKPGVRETLKLLNELGIELKILTGDNALVTKNICDYVGIKIKGSINGDSLNDLDDNEIKKMALENTIFTRLTPIQKEKIIKSLQSDNNIVGFLGDGINDAPALKVADVGISVNNAVDIAKETADIILLEKSLSALEDGVIEGRRVFGNIVKYIKMGSSSNFGNMISPTIASIFLKFLPMLPIQILLNNFLYDLSQISIPTDNIDPDYIKKPKPWDVQFIKRFMFIFGPISSVFDLVTFGVLVLMKAPQNVFHTVWFLESLTTQTLVIHIIRTQKIPFIQSKPSRPLLFTSLLIVGAGYAIVYSSLGKHMGFIGLPGYYIGIVAGIVICYLFTVQFAKILFSKKYSYT